MHGRFCWVDSCDVVGAKGMRSTILTSTHQNLHAPGTFQDPNISSMWRNFGLVHGEIKNKNQIRHMKCRKQVAFNLPIQNSGAFAKQTFPPSPQEKSAQPPSHPNPSGLTIHCSLFQRNRFYLFLKLNFKNPILKCTPLKINKWIPKMMAASENLSPAHQILSHSGYLFIKFRGGFKKQPYMSKISAGKWCTHIKSENSHVFTNNHLPILCHFC